MAQFNSELAEDIVRKALNSITDEGTAHNIQNFSFEHFKELQKKMFLKNLKIELKRKGFDAPVSIGLFDTWNNAQNCIEYLMTNSIPKLVE